MRIYKTMNALFSESYDRQAGVIQVVVIRDSLLEQVKAARNFPVDDETLALTCALNLYAAFYEKNPDPINRLKTLVGEIGKHKVTQFQKASQLLGKVDPEWEVPVLVITWLKKKSDINKVIGNPICSKCKKELANIGNLFDDLKAGGGHVAAAYTDGTMSVGVDPLTASGWDQWLGTICPNCDSIFCEDCLNASGKDPCPVCHNRVIPALAKDLPIKQNFRGDTGSMPNLNQDGEEKVVFVREIKKQAGLAPTEQVNTCTVYRAESAQIARDFLANCPVSDDNIIIIETPEGNFGKNKDGIYRSNDEHY